jgi:hypothetical protein
MPAKLELPASSANCRVVLTEEAIAYLQQQGGSLGQEVALGIPSQYAQGYPLANGEVVVLENGLRAASPALIFSTVGAFEACRRADRFPLPPAYLTWLEAHAEEVRRFLTNPAVYAGPLRAVLQVDAPFSTLAACEAAFERVRLYLRKKSLPWETREPLVYAFGLAVAQFCVAQWGLSCKFRKMYATYNSYYEPLLRQPDGQRGELCSVFGPVIMLTRPNHKPGFQAFMWWVTGIPPVKQTGSMSASK